MTICFQYSATGFINATVISSNGFATGLPDCPNQLVVYGSPTTKDTDGNQIPLACGMTLKLDASGQPQLYDTGDGLDRCYVTERPSEASGLTE